MNEFELISRIAAQFPRSRAQGNALFECDCELVKLGGRWWGLTMDEFSPEEDLFTSESPAILGANLAVATLSDLLAAGIEPEFFMQSLVLPKKAEAAFVDGLTDGIKGVLGKAGCHLCGGDLGSAQNWRYTGFAMGPAAGRGPLTRRLAAGACSLWVTGRFGDANLAVLNKLPTPRFELRLAEAKFISRCAAACIDTSGGLIDSAWQLRTQNPLTRFELDLERIPLAVGVAAAAGNLGVAAETFLLGGAGEYELLFALPEGAHPAQARKLAGMGAVRIGTARRSAAPGLFFNRGGRPLSEMKAPAPCPRSAKTLAAYMRAVMAVSNKLFGGGSK
ncbi:MAG TPA: AIR synthase related protein [Elusimicrobiales bacterium]|nr:AIR synthase related protein [Elusimicrobiales bacterium]